MARIHLQPSPRASLRDYSAPERTARAGTLAGKSILPPGAAIDGSYRLMAFVGREKRAGAFEHRGSGNTVGGGVVAHHADGMCVEQRRLTPPAGTARDERTAPQGHEDGVWRVPHALVARGELHSPVAPRAYVDRSATISMTSSMACPSSDRRHRTQRQNQHERCRETDHSVPRVRGRKQRSRM